MKNLILIVFMVAFPFTVFSSELEVSEGIVTLLNIVAPFLADFASRYEWVAVALQVLIYTRIIVKPVMSALIEISSNVPEGKFRKFMRDMSDHFAYKLVAYILDWFASIKLPKK